MKVCVYVFDSSPDIGDVNTKELCRCTLDDLMEAHAEETYLSWDQPVRDAAAAPYITECWPEG